MKALLRYLSKIEIYSLALVLGLVFGNAYGAENLPASEADQFRALKNEILEVNCYDCYGGSEANLRSAVQQLEALVNSGFDLLEPKQLLADSYHQIGIVYATRNSQERGDLLGKNKQLYAELLDEYPDDVGLLVAYGSLVEDLEASERARSRLKELLANASWSSGTRLNVSADAGERERGLELMLDAYEFGSFGARRAYGVRLVGVLNGRNLTERAESVLTSV